MSRLILAWLAFGTASGVAVTSLAQQPSSARPSIQFQDRLNGYVRDADSQQGRELQWKQAQDYCSGLGRHATIQMRDEVKHATAFHCYRTVTRQQFINGDTGY